MNPTYLYSDIELWKLEFVRYLGLSEDLHRIEIANGDTHPNTQLSEQDFDAEILRYIDAIEPELDEHIRQSVMQIRNIFCTGQLGFVYSSSATIAAVTKYTKFGQYLISSNVTTSKTRPEYHLQNMQNTDGDENFRKLRISLETMQNEINTFLTTQIEKGDQLPSDAEKQLEKSMMDGEEDGEEDQNIEDD
ncbi:uncharacterized protein V1516DRAFT_689663 [Lipomyces oligophaga]|uniref:uncharacterized protein n=1 Tax=Lipomyces oligophaga TaxID=45792 RepID=UPI0034CDBF64